MPDTGTKLFGTFIICMSFAIGFAVGLEYRQLESQKHPQEHPNEVRTSRYKKGDWVSSYKDDKYGCYKVSDVFLGDYTDRYQLEYCGNTMFEEKDLYPIEDIDEQMAYTINALIRELDIEFEKIREKLRAVKDGK